jgi:membrane-bound lytic murein transglycosylase D
MNCLRYILLLIISVQSIFAQEVPNHIEFGGIDLHLSAGAQKRIQADVAMITKNAAYFQQKIDRANLYFPIIEKAFNEEGVPSDFKFLALQESSLVSDAVSSSNAVGYWQFKKESAIEVGVRVDENVDERKHIDAASHGAAKYLKRNNGALNNWVYALLSYNLGLGGVKSHVQNKYVGSDEMEIDDDMHWYVFRFLAHKIAYQNVVGKDMHPQYRIVGYKVEESKTLSEVSKETAIDEQLLLDYNKWCTHQRIPQGGVYTVILPVPHEQYSMYQAKYENDHASPAPVQLTAARPSNKEFVSIDHVENRTFTPLWVTINGVKAVKISKGETIDQITLKAKISKNAFISANEIGSYQHLEEGSYYYLQHKKANALVMFHTVQKGETVWDVAQHYAVTTKSILRKNRMDDNEALKEGRVLWLQKKRPKETPIEYKSITKPQVIKEPIDVPVVVTTPVVMNSDKFVYYTVQAGETVFSISRKFQVDSDQIKKWNNLKDYSISVNQVLIVGEKQAVTTHTVAQGETLYKIAQQYGVSVSDILTWNNKKDNSISIGEVLEIKK